MRDFNWDDFEKGDIVAVNCRTKEAAKNFLGECENRKLGLDCLEDGVDEYTNNSFEHKKESTCYSICRDLGFGYDDVEYHEQYKFKIIEWEIDEMKSEKKVYKIQDLYNKGFVMKKFRITNKPYILRCENNEYMPVVRLDGGVTILDTVYESPINDIYCFDDLMNMNFELIEEENQKNKTKGYLANGLFGLGDRLLNELLAKHIRENVDVDLYVPQENMAINDKQAYANSKQIYEGDYNYLKETDFLVAVIDGSEIDSGTAAEIGVVSTMSKKIYALYTDTRQQGTENQRKIEALVNDSTENQFIYKNLFVVGLIKKHGYIFDNIEDLVKKLKEDINKKTKGGK